MRCVLVCVCAFPASWCVCRILDVRACVRACVRVRVRVRVQKKFVRKTQKQAAGNRCGKIQKKKEGGGETETE